MPLYEYECQDCSERVEVFQKVDDPKLTDCPKCKAKGRLKKVFHPVGVVFKGSGFYTTDYARKQSKGQPAAPKEKEGGAAAAPSGEKKGDSASGENKPAKPSSSAEKKGG